MKRMIFGMISFIAALVVLVAWMNQSFDKMIALERNWNGPWYLIGLTICVGFGCWAFFAPRKKG